MTTPNPSRRGFLKGAAASAFTAPYVSAMARPSRHAAAFDPSFGSATDALAALEHGVISSRELTAHVFKRVKTYNPKVNAFITLLEDDAMQQASAADEARARGKAHGRLHGLPITIKDMFDVAGVPTTDGDKAKLRNVPREDSLFVARLKAAGAIVIAKTSLPPYGQDAQTYNEVIGVTNNPWDVTKTVGGSTGGGAAALAVGMSFLETGGDTGGSIRIPASFCGVYGHIITPGVVPGPIGSVETGDIGTPGPLARSAEDLALHVGVVGGPSYESVAYSWRLPAARKSRLKDYKIGFMLDDPFCPVESEVRDVLESALASLRMAGVALAEGWPAGFDFRAADAGRGYLALAAASGGLPDPVFESAVRDQAKGRADPLSAVFTAFHRDWLQHQGRRMKMRALWQTYFQQFDAFLSPVVFMPAFPHDVTLPFDFAAPFRRRLKSTTGERPYTDLVHWISPASYLNLPATSAPVGLTKSGLPVGLQIIGPLLEDATPIDIAARLAQVHGGFHAPPGFA